MSFHVKPFEKEVFEEVIFLLKYHQKTPSPPETEHRRKRDKKYWKREKKKKKEKGKEKLQESLQIKGKSIFWEKKNTSTSKILFWCDFLLLHHTISKTLYKIIEKVFLAHFGPSFSLVRYMTWVVPFLFTHELHIFSLWRVGWKGTFVEPRWGITYQKECPSA
jgi:hypothetical protein